MATLEKVKAVKDELKRLYSAAPWYNGVAVVRSGDEFSLRLNALDGNWDLSTIPTSLDGVNVELTQIEYVAR